MGDQIGGVVWFSSGIIFGSCCDGVLWLDRFNVYHLLSFWPTWRQEIIIIRYYNCNPCRCGTIGQLVLVMGSVLLLPVLVIPIIMLFICLVKLWVLFLSVVETLVIVSGG